MYLSIFFQWIGSLCSFYVLKVILDIIQERNHFDNLLSCGMQEPSYEEMEIVVQNYVQSLINEHPYWNRSQGADHFFVHCHETIDVPLLNNAIRVLCATQDVRQFNPSMDMFLPPLGYDIYPADFNLSSGYDFIDRYIAHIIKKKKNLFFQKYTCSKHCCFI